MGQRLEKAIGCGSTPGEEKVIGCERLEKGIGCGSRLEKAMGQHLEKAIGCGSTPGEGDRLWVNAWRTR